MTEANRNLCLIAVYEPLDRNVPKTRASAVVSSVPANKLLDRVVFDNLNFDDEDELDEANAKIQAMMQKHSAQGLGLHDLVPRRTCPKCKSILDAVVFEKDEEPYATLVCFKCTK
jgi:hypothetical protein